MHYGVLENYGRYKVEKVACNMTIKNHEGVVRVTILMRYFGVF